jgi:PAS domain S-box-containing protein
LSLKEEIDLLVRQNEALIQTLSLMGARLDTSLRQLSAISSLTVVPIQASSLQDAASMILDVLLHELNDIAACSLLMYDENQDCLRLLAARGQADILGEIEGPYNRALTFKPGQGVAGKVFADNAPLFWTRGEDDENTLIKSEALSTPESLACLPLSVSGRPIGVLNISFGRPSNFGHTQRRDLILLSGVVANIVHTFSLKAELNEKATGLKKAQQGLEIRVRERTAELAQANLTLKREIDEHRETSSKLRQSEKRYRELFESITDFIFAHTSQGEILSINPAAAGALGYEPDQIVGRSMADLLPPRCRATFQEDYLDPTMDLGQHRGTFLLMSNGGQERHVDYRSRLVQEPDAAPYVAVSGRDITDNMAAQQELRSLEEQLTQSQKMQAVGTLASGIAHDFNNILQAISGYVQLLLGSDKDPGTTERYLNGVDGAVKRASELVNNLLTFSRKMDPDLQPLDVNAVILQAVRLLERVLPRMISVETYLMDELWKVSGDPNQLIQVLMNMGTNARDAILEGGRVVLESRNVTFDKDYAQAYLDLEAGRYVEIKIWDTGIGMDEPTLRQVFEPFFTTKDVGKGTGLGLSTVYGIVKSHNGHVTVRSELGLGSTFTIYLPALGDSDVQENIRENELEDIHGGDETILLVDDEKAIIEIARDVLSRHGYKVLTADGGERALDLYRQHSSEIDLVILDLGMPGIGGHSCLLEMLRINPEACVLIASGYSLGGSDKDPIKNGAAGFLSKPYRLADMLRKVRSVLDA